MTTLTGKFVYEDNTPVANGILVLTLSQPCIISGTAQIVPLVKVIQLDANGNIPAAVTVYGNDALTPSGTTYTACLYTGVLDNATGLYNTGAQLFSLAWSITGASVDVSTLTPTTNGASYVSPVTSIGLTMPGEFSVSGSPVTSAGTFVVSKVVQSANQVYAGPTSGGSAAPGFRALVDADIPSPLTNKALTTPTLTNPKLAASSTIQDSGAAVSMGVTQKLGSGLGDYTTTSASYADIDATNLSFTTVVPTGWKLLVMFTGTFFMTGGTAFLNFAIKDGSSVVMEGETVPSAVAFPFTEHLQWVITGDGASHTVRPQWKVSTQTANLQNSASTIRPTLICVLMPSN